MSTATLETKIYEAIKARVSHVGTVLGMKVAYPAENFEPDTKNGFLIFNNMPNISERPSIANDENHYYNGIAQIDIMLPVGLHVNSRSVQLAGLIIDEFPESIRMEFEGITVRVTKRGDYAAGYRDGNMWRVPVSIRWLCIG